MTFYLVVILQIHFYSLLFYLVHKKCNHIGDAPTAHLPIHWVSRFLEFLITLTNVAVVMFCISKIGPLESLMGFFNPAFMLAVQGPKESQASIREENANINPAISCKAKSNDNTSKRLAQRTYNWGRVIIYSTWFDFQN